MSVQGEWLAQKLISRGGAWQAKARKAGSTSKSLSPREGSSPYWHL